MAVNDISVLMAHIPSLLQGKRHFQTQRLNFLALRWVSVLRKFIFHVGKEKRLFQRRGVFDFLFIYFYFLHQKMFQPTNTRKANVRFVHCFISQLQTMVRALGFASLVRSAGLILGFSKLLRARAAGLGAHVGDSCI